MKYLTKRVKFALEFSREYLSPIGRILLLPVVLIIFLISLLMSESVIKGEK